jgi:hypothetical protein
MRTSDRRLDHAQHGAQQTQERAEVANDVQVFNATELIGGLLANGGLHGFLHGGEAGAA